MYLQEPLAGFKITAGYLILQIAFAIEAVVFLIRYDDLSEDFQRTLKYVISFFVICFASSFISSLLTRSKLGEKDILNTICDYIFIVSSTAGVYYVLTTQDEVAGWMCSVTAVEDFSTNADQNTQQFTIYKKAQEQYDVSMYFIFLIIHYFLTIIFAITFIFIQTILPYQKKIRVPRSNQVNLLSTVDTSVNGGEDGQGIKQKEQEPEEDEDEDFLTIVTPIIQSSFYRYGVMSIFALIAWYYTDQNVSDVWDGQRYNDYLAQSIVLFILFVYEVIDTFSSTVFHKALFAFKHIMQAILYIITTYSFYESWLSENVRYGRIWPQIYFYILIIELILSIFQYFEDKRNGKGYTFSLGFSQDYTKKSFTFKQENNVDMTDDIYCVCYLANFFLFEKKLIESGKIQEAEFEKQVQDEAKEIREKDIEDIKSGAIEVDVKKSAKLFQKCLLIFTIQVLMSYFVLESFNADGTGLTSADTFEILLIRVLCAIFLHVQVYEEINQALRMYNFAINQVSESGRRNAMISVSIMKAISSLTTEICNILLISTENKSLDIIKDFVALTIIAQLDSIYSLTMKNNKIRARLENRELYYDKNMENQAKNGGFFYYFWISIYEIISKIFISAFYYFLPFSIPFISYSVYLSQPKMKCDFDYQTRDSSAATATIETTTTSSY